MKDLFQVLISILKHFEDVDFDFPVSLEVVANKTRGKEHGSEQSILAREKFIEVLAEYFSKEDRSDINEVDTRVLLYIMERERKCKISQITNLAFNKDLSDEVALLALIKLSTLKMVELSCSPDCLVSKTYEKQTVEFVKLV